jgi:hypothetical protein
MAPEFRSMLSSPSTPAAAIALTKQMKSSHQQDFTTLVLKHAFANSIKNFGL